MHLTAASLVLFLAASSALAQSADPVIGTINDRPVTRSQFDAYVSALPAAQQRIAAAQPELALRNWALFQRLAADATAAGLDQRSPYREQVERAHEATMALTAEETLLRGVPLDDAGLQKYYDAHRSDYDQIRFRLIAIKSAGRTDAEAKAKADGLADQLRRGGDFIALVRQHSEAPSSKARDGEYVKPVTRHTALPPAALDALFATAVGHVVGPVRAEDSYYLFRVEERTAQPLDAVKDEVREEFREASLRDALTRAGLPVVVDVKDARYFSGAELPPSTVVATINGQALTATQVAARLQSLPPAAQAGALRDRRRTLAELALLDRLVAYATREHLDQRPPWRDRLAYGRMTTLAQAQSEQRTNTAPITQGDVESYYGAHADRFAEVRLRGVTVPFPSPAAKDEASAKALAKKLGAHLPSAMPSQAELDAAGAKPEPEATRRLTELPEPAQKAIAAVKPGSVSEPVRVNDAFSVFCVKERRTAPLDNVAEEIRRELRRQSFERYMAEVNRDIRVTLAPTVARP